MVRDEKNPVIDLPLKITLTTEGIEWFIRHKRSLKRLRMADNRIEYGISLDNFSAASLQKMINIDYIASVELARIEFSSKRKEILDLSKLIVYRILYKKFAQEATKIFLNSPLIRRWNRLNPSKIIDEDSSLNQQYVESLLFSVAGEIPEVSAEIQRPLFQKIGGNPTLSEDERKILFFLIDRYMISMPNIIWCVLVKSRAQSEYSTMIGKVRLLVEEFLEKARIAEYLALMIVELLSFIEATHYLQVTREIFPRNGDLNSGIVLNEQVRNAVQRRMLQQADYLYITFQISGKGASIGTENRLRITLFNREREYRRVKEQIENKMDIDLKERSLYEFYRESPGQEIDPELGLYYLSYLHDACAKQNVRFDSNVNLLARSDLAIINISLQF